jgi:hypothetical protein
MPPGAKAADGGASGKVQFRAYEVVDQQQGGMVVSRIAVPQDWKTTSRVVWNYNDFYLPVRASLRTASPDGAAWIEFFPNEFFLWLDPAHDRGGPNSGGIGGIHHPNIKLPEAMVRYVIAPNRSSAKKLRILGYRPVNDLPQTFFGKNAKLKGDGICMRVSYELNGSPVDEEFYGFLSAVEAIPGPNPRIPIMEYHRQLILAHSMGAKSGKLESIRPLLGFMATSLQTDPAWQQRVTEVRKKQGEIYQRIMAQNYRGIQAAGERSRMLTAQSNEFLHQMDAEIAARNSAQRGAPSSFSSDSTSDFYKRADDFDQNIRGTEHMVDQNGAVSDQYTDYNYHWTDGYGTYVHTNDPNFDPNHYLTGSYEKLTPAPR